MALTDEQIAAAAAFFGTTTPAAAPMPQATYQADADGWTAYGRAALESAIERVATAVEGTRNDTLNRECYGISRLISGGHVPAAAAWDALEQAARCAGLPDKEIAGTLRSATRAGQANPRQVETRPGIDPGYIFHPARYADEHGEAAATSQADQLAAWVAEHLPAVNWAEEWDKPTDIEWILFPLIACARLGVIYSTPKTGKSLLALELAARIATGTHTWGSPVKPRTVLYVDFENDLHTDTIARLKNMGYRHDQLDRLKLLSMPVLPGLDTKEGSAQLMLAVRHYQPELVIIDTLSRAIDGEENSNDTYLQLYRQTLQPLKAMGVAVLRLDHTGKDASKGQRGASAKEGDVDAIWQLTTVADGHLRLTCEAHRFPLDETDLNIERTTRPLAHVWEDWRDAMEAKEDEFNRILDKAGQGAKVGRPTALKIVREAGMKVRSDDAAEWLRRRRTRAASIGQNRLQIVDEGNDE